MEILGVLKSGPNACDEDLRLSLETLVALSDQVLVEPTLLERAHVLLPRESLAADREISPAWIIELQSGESIDPKDWALTREAMEDFEVDREWVLFRLKPGRGTWIGFTNRNERTQGVLPPAAPDSIHVLFHCRDAAVAFGNGFAQKAALMPDSDFGEGTNGQSKKRPHRRRP